MYSCIQAVLTGTNPNETGEAQEGDAVKTTQPRHIHRIRSAPKGKSMAVDLMVAGLERKLAKRPDEERDDFQTIKFANEDDAVKGYMDFHKALETKAGMKKVLAELSEMDVSMDSIFAAEEFEKDRKIGRIVVIRNGESYTCTTSLQSDGKKPGSSADFKPELGVITSKEEEEYMIRTLSSPSYYFKSKHYTFIKKVERKELDKYIGEALQARASIRYSGASCYVMKDKEQIGKLQSTGFTCDTPEEFLYQNVALMEKLDHFDNDARILFPHIDPTPIRESWLEQNIDHDNVNKVVDDAEKKRMAEDRAMLVDEYLDHGDKNMVAVNRFGEIITSDDDLRVDFNMLKIASPSVRSREFYKRIINVSKPEEREVPWEDARAYFSKLFKGMNLKDHTLSLLVENVCLVMDHNVSLEEMRRAAAIISAIHRVPHMINRAPKELSPSPIAVKVPALVLPDLFLRSGRPGTKPVDIPTTETICDKPEAYLIGNIVSSYPKEFTFPKMSSFDMAKISLDEYTIIKMEETPPPAPPVHRAKKAPKRRCIGAGVLPASE